MRLFLASLALVLSACVGIPIHAKTAKREIPADFDDVAYEWVDVPVDEETSLRGIFVRGDGPPVLVLYGSGMAIAGIRDLLRSLRDAGYSVLCCDYRGTGHSTGRWGTSRYLDDDARILFEWLRTETGEKRVGVVGVSIGAVASGPLLTRDDPPAVVVLDRPVDPRTVIHRFMAGSTGEVGGTIAEWIARPTIDFELHECLAQARPPTLVLLPEYDYLLPPKDAERLLEDASPQVVTETVPGGHLSSHLVRPTLWRTVLLGFLDRHLRPGQPALGGRELPPDPVGVKAARLDGRLLTVEFADDPPEVFTLLLMGHKGNGLIRLKGAPRRLAWELSRKEKRKLGPLFAARAVPDDWIQTVGTRWYPAGHPVPAGD
ncbi:MAG: alpha/beta hydrolase family protein [Planctomycetota bacterium]